ncbi:hypothetical protein C8F04DRAFT_1196883 [Mycena alexandri]|uniref:Uncharacterized protein n=1 Tax=Mycena alexandri TaxID=1745969 RepID=A0AAD6S6U2_9AGAR|nr:hypothetical protein C8F04DRAFT_1196883 [Mycena alexandri]
MSSSKHLMDIIAPHPPRRQEPARRFRMRSRKCGKEGDVPRGHPPESNSSCDRASPSATTTRGQAHSPSRRRSSRVRHRHITVVLVAVDAGAFPVDLDGVDAGRLEAEPIEALDEDVDLACVIAGGLKTQAIEPLNEGVDLACIVSSGLEAKHVEALQKRVHLVRFVEVGEGRGQHAHSGGEDAGRTKLTTAVGLRREEWGMRAGRAAVGLTRFGQRSIPGSTPPSKSRRLFFPRVLVEEVVVLVFILLLVVGRSRCRDAADQTYNRWGSVQDAGGAKRYDYGKKLTRRRGRVGRVNGGVIGPRSTVNSTSIDPRAIFTSCLRLVQRGATTAMADKNENGKSSAQPPEASQGWNRQTANRPTAGPPRRLPIFNFFPLTNHRTRRRDELEAGSGGKATIGGEKLLGPDQTHKRSRRITPGHDDQDLSTDDELKVLKKSGPNQGLDASGRAREYQDAQWFRRKVGFRTEAKGIFMVTIRDANSEVRDVAGTTSRLIFTRPSAELTHCIPT